MSLPASEFWFSLSIRRNRKSFILANIALFLIMALVVYALVFFDVRIKAGNAIFYVFYVPFIFTQYFLTAQRLRDFGKTGWLALLWIPVSLLPQHFSGIASLTFLIILCVVPGTLGENRYGDDPLSEW